LIRSKLKGETMQTIEVPEKEMSRFKELRAAGFTLERSAPLMPRFNCPRGFFKSLKAFKKIKMLPAGTSIVFDELRMKGDRPWYKIRVADSLVTGWINGIILEGGL